MSQPVEMIGIAVRTLFGPSLAGIYREKPMAAWPWWASILLDVSTPANLPRKTRLSPDGVPNVNIICKLLARTNQIPGDVAECGVYRGTTLAAIALHLKHTGSEKRIYGFDSFTGFDASVAKDLTFGGVPDPDKREGGWSNTSLSRVQNKMHLLGLNSVTLIPGYFNETFSKCPAERFSFVHLDCDLYDSYLIALNHFYPRMAPGGIILIDEYNDPHWPGCNLAVDEFLSDKPEQLTMMMMNNYEKYFIEKI